MIDDVQLHSGANTANHVIRVLSNFTTQPTYQNGSTEGWLDNVSAPNQWQWVSSMGVNGPVTDVDSFEDPHMMPEGWSIENFRGVGWSHGMLKHHPRYHNGIQVNTALVSISTVRIQQTLCAFYLS